MVEMVVIRRTKARPTREVSPSKLTLGRLEVNAETFQLPTERSEEIPRVRKPVGSWWCDEERACKSDPKAEQMEGILRVIGLGMGDEICAPGRLYMHAPRRIDWRRPQRVSALSPWQAEATPTWSRRQAYEVALVKWRLPDLVFTPKERERVDPLRVSLMKWNSPQWELYGEEDELGRWVIDEDIKILETTIWRH